MNLVTFYFRLSPSGLPANASDYQIGGLPVRFLQPALLKTCRIADIELPSTDFGLDGITLVSATEIEFFLPKWPRRLLAVTVEVTAGQPITAVKDALPQQIWEQLPTRYSQTTHNLYLYSCTAADNEQGHAFASQVLRGSRTLTAGIPAFAKSSGVRLVHDAKGFATLVDKPVLARYQRLVLLYSLAIAYHEQLQGYLDRFREVLFDDDDAALLPLREESIRFNAQFYFDNPVLNGRIELRPKWRPLAKSFLLHDTSAEFQNQLDAVAQIAAIRAEERNEQRHTEAREQQEQRDARMQKQQHYTNVGLAVIGVLLAALSLF